MTGFAVGAASDVGRRRDINEDCALVSERVVAVADGMGGHAGGEIASAVAVESLRRAMGDPQVDTLSGAVEVANRAVWDRGDDEDLRGMGTTLVALALVGHPDEVDPDVDESTGVAGEPLALANVGDSRAYVLTADGVERLTEDHSLVEGLVREGKLTPEEAAVHPHRNVVTRVLGLADVVEVDAWQLEPRVGDRYLLCSDGLFNEVPEPRIAAVLRGLADPQEAAHELVSLANVAGGRDNITVVVVDVVDERGTLPERLGTRVVRGPTAASVDMAGFTAVAPSTMPLGAQERAIDIDPERGVESDPIDDDERSMLPRVVSTERDGSSGRFTWRTAVFVLLFLGVFVVAAVAVVWYGNNGFFVTTMRLPSFLVTLASMGLVAGLARQLTGLESVPVQDATFTWLFGAGTLLGIPILLWWTAAAVLVGWHVVRQRRLGAHVLAVGNSERAAEVSGIKVNRVKMAVFMISGMTAALAGILYDGRLGGARYTLGEADLMTVLAAVIVGGSALSGGRASIVGALVGSLLMSMINNGLILAGLDVTQQMIVRAVIILVAVSLSLRGKKHQ